MKKTILLIGLLSGFAFRTIAQIPNSGFESWTNHGNYYTPDNWDNLNAMTSSKGIYTCIRGVPGVAGNYFLELVSYTVSGMGVMPGIAVCGKLNTTTMKAISGFPFNQRPKSITGEWQYMASYADTGYMDVFLTRWNSAKNNRDTIAKLHDILMGMEMNWVKFSVDLKYLSGSDPDSAVIIFNASGTKPADQSYIFVDELAFSGNVAGMDPEMDPYFSRVDIYPNPVSGNTLYFNFSDAHSGLASIQVISMDGKEILNTTANLSSAHSIDISDIPAGQYILKMSGNEAVAHAFFVKL